jgi:transcriptional regulator with XRE-family HTH domain
MTDDHQAVLGRVQRPGREAAAVAQRRSQERLVDQLPALMQARALSINRLAQLVGVSQSHLSRAVRSADRKSISGDLAERIANAMDLPADWFPETRRERVLERVRSDPVLCDRLYDELIAKEVRRASQAERR